MIKLGSKGADVARMQTLLNSQLVPSPQLTVDGDFGQKSHDALVRFQKSRGLAADGVVGPLTWTALGQKPVVKPAPPPTPVVAQGVARSWFAIAEAEIGVTENDKPGQHNPRIIEFHSTTTLRARTDETYWCSSFVNWVMIQSGRKGTDSAAAKSWLKWGTALTTPRVGAITVLRKKEPNPKPDELTATGFHVAFYLATTKTHIELLGGNQSNSVRRSKYLLSKYDIKGYRWPI